MLLSSINAIIPPPRSSLDKKYIKLPSEDNPYIKSIPQKLKEAKDHLPELKQTYLAMDDDFIDSLRAYSGKEKQWWKEYRDVMLQKLQHVDETQSSVKTYTIENRQPDFEEMKKVFPALTEEGWKTLQEQLPERKGDLK